MTPSLTAALFGRYNAAGSGACLCQRCHLCPFPMANIKLEDLTVEDEVKQSPILSEGERDYSAIIRGWFTSLCWGSFACFSATAIPVLLQWMEWFDWAGKRFSCNHRRVCQKSAPQSLSSGARPHKLSRPQAEQTRWLGVPFQRAMDQKHLRSDHQHRHLGGSGPTKVRFLLPLLYLAI